MRISISSSVDISKYKSSIHNRMKSVKSIIGDKISSHLVDEVKSRIPNEGGWFDIYRGSIKFHHQGDLWSVIGEADVELTQVPANKSLAFFSGSSRSAAALAAFNPYPIDTIPPVNGGITGDVRIVSASIGEVMAHRERHADSQKDIASALSRQGLSVDWSERPIINGKVVADLRFLSKRLEHGLGGFPRVPHWTPATRSAERNAESLVNGDANVSVAIEKAFKA